MLSWWIRLLRPTSSALLDHLIMLMSMCAKLILASSPLIIVVLALVWSHSQIHISKEKEEQQPQQQQPQQQPKESLINLRTCRIKKNRAITFIRSHDISFFRVWFRPGRFCGGRSWPPVQDQTRGHSPPPPPPSSPSSPSFWEWARSRHCGN